MKHLILGIDPGLKGALAIFDTRVNLITDVIDMPSIDKKLDLMVLANAIKTVAPHVIFSVIERTHSMPKQGVASTFKFGFVTGAVHGILHAHDISVYMVEPSVWKGLMNLSRDKKSSLALARKKFPSQIHRFERAKDDGRAEAALIAWFGVQRLLKKHLNEDLLK